MGESWGLGLRIPSLYIIIYPIESKLRKSSTGPKIVYHTDIDSDMIMLLSVDNEDNHVKENGGQSGQRSFLKQESFSAVQT